MIPYPNKRDMKRKARKNVRRKIYEHNKQVTRQRKLERDQANEIDQEAAD